MAKCSPCGVRAPASRSCWVTDELPKRLGSFPLRFPSTWPPHCTQTLCPWPGEDSRSPAPPITLSPLLQPVVPGALKGGERWAWPPTSKQVQGDQQGPAVGTPHDKHTHSPVRVRGQGLGARGRWAGGGHSSVRSGLNETGLQMPPPPPQETVGQASSSQGVRGLGHTPNACPPKTQLSPVLSRLQA